MRRQEFLVLGLMLLAVLARVIPHPPNVAPVAALSLFSMYHIRERLLYIFLPAVSMFIGDLLIGWSINEGLYAGWMAQGMGFHKGSINLYLIITLITALTLLFKPEKNIFRLGKLSLAGSTLFFILSNLMVWLNGTMYTLDFQGLINCYLAAIPFVS